MVVVVPNVVDVMDGQVNGAQVNAQLTSPNVALGDAERVATELTRLDAARRVEELARMLGGHEITAKTRAHAKELLAQNQRRESRPR